MKFFLRQIWSYKVLFALLFFITTSFGLTLFFMNSKKHLTVYKSYPWQEGELLARVDYRIFACGEELFLEATKDSPAGRGEGLYATSIPGSIIARGLPHTYGEASLPAFFEAIGGKLETPIRKMNTKVMNLPTSLGVREFHNGNLCGDQPAQLWVLHHRVEPSPQLSTVHPRVLWKYFDYGFRNNYGTVPPGDCLLFLFDSKDALHRPWPRCKAHDEAVIRGELVFENPVY